LNTMGLIRVNDTTLRRLRIHIASENMGRTYGLIGPMTEDAINNFIDWKEQELEDDKCTSH